MCKLFDEWSKDIEQFCDANNFSFAKASKLSQSWGKYDGKDTLALSYFDPNNERGKLGLLDDIPMPLVLMISKENGKLHFEQTEHTRKYL